MKISIDTGMKTVTVEQVAIKELGKIKKALEAIGENPDLYNVVSAYQQYTYYPVVNVPSIWTTQPFPAMPEVYYTTSELTVSTN